MLGYTNQEWSSCLTSEAPPRGKLDLLSGGYNRIPVAQVGADIFCDTSLIADELAAIADEPSLANEALNQGLLTERQWLESKLFFACVNKAFSLSLLRRIAKDKGLWNLLLFLKDRIEMGAKASVSLGSPRSANKHIKQGLSYLSENLSSNEFIGGNTPNILDFSAYHCFWFLTEVGLKKDISKNTAALAWYQKMKAFTNSPDNEISIDTAIDIGREAQPRQLDKRYTSDHRIGSKVVIAPSDYRQVPVTGTLVGVDSQRWIISRNNPETGLIHLHFPSNAVDVNIRLPKQ
ncbi:hypothetical protein A3749_14145 [Oleiphilus sp. HI0078]|nr:hypothetical protein A3741_24070 [Oleiphilus sp. HI0069]KZZ08815.1 hypothetical protein A3749_14145 [Oleiphilus sp. HI0078]KZZ33161.1 hypothetical protein A3755_08380 [Oleiphilus sp. HI0085]KZZ70479.1 hypothetical protein A3763_12335 [Oleiphilus sp. HI0128]